MSSIKPTKSQSIALLDCNSFFCSCERLFAPAYIKRPIVVLSSNDGCAISLSREAKALGIKVGTPYYQFKHLFERANGRAFSANFTLYADISNRVMQTIASLGHPFDVNSIDEAFIDFKHPLEKTFPLAQELKIKVERDTGIPVSVGVSCNKLLAKMANYQAKNLKVYQGICILPAAGDEFLQLIKNLPIEELWGVGRNLKRRFFLLNILTAFDLYSYPHKDKLYKHFGIVGQRLQQSLQGLATTDWSLEEEKKQSMICSRTFSQPLYDLQTLKEAIAEFTSHLAEKLRRQKSLCSNIGLYLQGPETPYSPRSHHFPLPTSDNRRLIKAAIKLLEETFQKGSSYKKAGVSISEFSDEKPKQVSFFPLTLDSPTDQTLMNTIDTINRREGHLQVKIAQCGTEQNWKRDSRLRSFAYTTRWSEILQVS